MNEANIVFTYGYIQLLVESSFKLMFCIGSLLILALIMRIFVDVHANELVRHTNYDICSSFEMKNEHNALEAKPTNLDTYTIHVGFI